MAGSEVLELYELHYSDLVLLSSDSYNVPSSSPSISSSSTSEIKRLESISRTLMETLGPSGPGLLSITNVPSVSTLRRKLLPLARKLALLNHDSRKRILQEHGLGSDVPLKNMERNVSSFAMQLKYVQGMNLGKNGASHGNGENHILEQDLSDFHRLGDVQDNEFENLGSTFKELGFCMIELGLRLARICDRAIGGQELEQSLLESCTAKGRLIHYHSAFDKVILKEAGRRRRSNKGMGICKRDEEHLKQGLTECSDSNTSGNKATSWASPSELWQQWHYDYGIFTVLTDPLFILPCHSKTTEAEDHFCMYSEQDCPATSRHTYLQILDPNKNKVLMVKSTPDSFIIQVGESADVLSKGKLRSTLHSVCRPGKLENLSRETFVVFLQPAWTKTFSILDYPLENMVLDSQCSRACSEKILHSENERSKLTHDIHNIVPPLSSRVKDGMTFAEFSRETTKQYYGGSGLQSKR